MRMELLFNSRQISAPCIFQLLQLQSLVNSICYSAVAFQADTGHVIGTNLNLAPVIYWDVDLLYSYVPNSFSAFSGLINAQETYRDMHVNIKPDEPVVCENSPPYALALSSRSPFLYQCQLFWQTQKNGYSHCRGAHVFSTSVQLETA